MNKEKNKMSNQLNLLKKQVREIQETSETYSIKKVVVGILYTGVELQDGTMGVSYTLTDRSTDIDGYHSLLQTGFLSDKSLNELIDNLSSKYAILRSIGLAAINAYSQSLIDFSKAQKQDIRKFITTSSNTLVGMVGNIQPISSYLNKKGVKMRILDKYASFSSNKNISKIDTINDLKNVDYLIVTGSALIFENFDQIIKVLPTISEKAILAGPSAQILPKLAYDLGFSIIGSSRIIDSKKVFKVLQEGGGYRFFKKFTEKYCFNK